MFKSILIIYIFNIFIYFNLLCYFIVFYSILLEFSCLFLDFRPRLEALALYLHKQVNSSTRHDNAKMRSKIGHYLFSQKYLESLI